MKGFRGVNEEVVESNNEGCVGCGLVNIRRLWCGKGFFLK